MAKVRHGVAGEPITHSLSPILTSIVHAHLAANESISKLPDLKGVAVVPSSGIENALAWGYAGTLPETPDWDLVGSPLGKFRGNTLLERAVKASMKIENADERLPTCSPPNKSQEKTPSHGHEEVWMSLTSPLKHQLSMAAVKYMGNSMESSSVNTLRWDGRTWWAATTDGEGLLMVVETFGHETGGVLGIIGGGGTARSTAASWCSRGGKINQLGGRRVLDEDGPWEFCDENPDLTIDFENEGGDISIKYNSMEGDIEERLQYLSQNPDGRWLLCAQHLLSWAKLWNPSNADKLPSLALLLHRLVACEVHLK
ncbi:MAG: hypothetical protein QGI21_06275 [Candidatus Poseidoniaceae archaeon]|jgi:hypothetical protein|nr:hypothetical protein [Candidatus Poseidoniaceae archaeon]